MRRLKRKWLLRSSTGHSSQRYLLRGPTGSSGCLNTWSMRMWVEFNFPYPLKEQYIQSPSLSFKPGDWTSWCVHTCLGTRWDPGLVSRFPPSQCTSRILLIQIISSGLHMTTWWSSIRGMLHKRQKCFTLPYKAWIIVLSLCRKWQQREEHCLFNNVWTVKWMMS